MNRAFALICLVAICDPARGDTTFQPYQTHAMSQDGSAVVRIELGEWSKDRKKRESKDQVVIYRYSKEADAYHRTARFDLGDLHPAECLFVTNDGRFVAFANVSGRDGRALALRIYNAEGKLLRKWMLADLLDKEEIEACYLTGSTIQWIEDAYFTRDEFRFFGPAKTMHGQFMSFTVMRKGKEGVSYSRTIDLRSMEIKKQ